jgi:hypothetical protein
MLTAVVTREETPGFFRFKLWELSTVITAEIKQTEDGQYTLGASRGIQTERQVGPYFVRHGVYASPGEALDTYRRALSPFFKSAVARDIDPGRHGVLKIKQDQISDRPARATDQLPNRRRC